MVGELTRRDLEDELSKIVLEESKIDAELAQYFGSSGETGDNNTLSFESYDIPNTLNKIKDFAPCFEAIEKDSNKLVGQIEECSALSERMRYLQNFF